MNENETYEHLITCPYCGWQDQNTWECGMDNDDVEIRECGKCQKLFEVICDVERSFWCKRGDQKELETKFR